MGGKTSGRGEALAPIVGSGSSSVKSAATKESSEGATRRGRPTSRSKRRQSHGSAWHWKQTDSWYYTLPGTRRRVALFDEGGERIRGLERKKDAQLALARARLVESGEVEVDTTAPQDRLVARVCSDYLQHCERSVANGSMSVGHRETSIRILNDLCGYCGALAVTKLKKADVQAWVDSHASWKSPSSRKGAIAIVQAAFNYAESNSDIPNPIKGLKRPTTQPRLHSLSPEDEETLYAATDEPFKNFLFAALHTGLRPFSELAKMTADDVVESDRGMMWRVYASKTKKTRKIPVRLEVAELTRKLMETAPVGSGIALFKNSRGTPWTRVAGVHRFCQLRKDLEWTDDPKRKRYSCYSCRHTFAHRMLSGYWNGGVGCSIEVLAELIGDTPKVAFDHYGREWGQHYQEPLWSAIGMGG